MDLRLAVRLIDGALADLAHEGAERVLGRVASSPDDDASPSNIQPMLAAAITWDRSHDSRMRRWYGATGYRSVTGRSQLRRPLLQNARYLRYGIVEHGLAHLACRRRGHSMVVVFTCRASRFCPSRFRRRISDISAHLRDGVARGSSPTVVCYLPGGCATRWLRPSADVLTTFIDGGP